MVDGLSLAEVVIVDDEEPARAEIRAALEGYTKSCIEIEGGPQLLRFMDQKPWNWQPELVLVDLGMPGMSGYDVIRRLREKFAQRHLPIVVVTKLGTGNDIMEAQVAGADAFVKKPATKEKLEAAIKAATAREPRRSIKNTIPYFL